MGLSEGLSGMWRPCRFKYPSKVVHRTLSDVVPDYAGDLIWVQLLDRLYHILEVLGTDLQDRGELHGLLDLPLPPVDGAYREYVGAGREALIYQRPGDGASGSLIGTSNKDGRYLSVHVVD